MFETPAVLSGFFYGGKELVNDKHLWFYNLSNKYLQDKRQFVRRVGINIFFELIKNKLKIDKSSFVVLELSNSEILKSISDAICFFLFSSNL